MPAYASSGRATSTRRPTRARASSGPAPALSPASPRTLEEGESIREGDCSIRVTGDLPETCARKRAALSLVSYPWGRVERCNLAERSSHGGRDADDPERLPYRAQGQRQDAHRRRHDRPGL